MMQEIKKIHQQSHQIYGAPKITKELEKSGHIIAQRTVSKYMKEANLRAHYRKAYVYPKELHRDFGPKLVNILKRDFRPQKPNQVWCTDITYIWTQGGFAYLSTIMDLFSRQIIAWKVSKDLSVQVVLDCIHQAKQKRKLDNPVVIHSDQGRQYISKSYREALGKQMLPSYSAKANPWDNACIESFHASLKREWLHRRSFKNLNELRAALFEYIEVFYNRRRIHSTLGYLTPVHFEEQFLQNS